MREHVPDWREYEEPGPPVKVQRITCSCGAIIQQKADLIWYDWHIHVLRHNITDLEAQVTALRKA